ncbi:MAG TPA: nuclear transport factor 2 family protein [Rhizobacter sp.]|nr:nuclear transport factor 2 family protein [Rhizobacter sp.]
MLSLRFLLGTALAALLTACASQPPDRSALERQVIEAETAFAKTMADRDHAAFTAFLATDTVFFSGPTPLRGKAAVAAGWKRFYDTPQAPFSWKPEKAEVLDNGTLAMTTGPVFDENGKPVASFTSVWRQESPGVWKIVFDKGCNCP